MTFFPDIFRKQIMDKISKRLVDRLRTPGRRAWMWDSELKGFWIALRPSGVHSYVFNYRDKHNHQRNITIGKVGALTPDAARKKAESYQSAVRDGRSPLAEKRAAKIAMTVSELIEALPKYTSPIDRKD